MLSARLDLVAEKGSKFVEEFQLIDISGNPIPLTNKQMRVIVKESEETDTKLFDFILPISDNARGMFSFPLCALDTNVAVNRTLYWIYVESTLSGQQCETECYIHGVLKFKEGAN